MNRSRSLISLLDCLCNAPETQPIMCRRIGVVFRLQGRQLRAREFGDGADDSDSDGDGGDSVRPLVLRFAGFVEGLRWIFPHALERELEDLWSLIDRRKRGYITFTKMMKRIVREERSRSPEPGPTHYSPQFTAIEPKSSAAVILPEALEPEQTAGLPSELFMDYNAFKAVKPRAAAAIFPKRKIDASWCNPVAREPFNDVAPDESQDGADTRQVRHRIVKSDQAGAPRSLTPRPPKHQSSRQGGQVPQRMTGGRAEGSVGLPHSPRSSFDSESSSLSSPSHASSNNTTKESAHRSPRGAIRTPQRPLDGAPVFAAATATSGTRSTVNPPGSRSLFYNDIAPLYLRFLNSKEVQKFMKQ